MQSDVTDTVKHQFSKGLAEANTPALSGIVTADMSLYGAATTPNLYKCVVSGGVSDLRFIIEKLKKWLWVRF